MNNKKICKIVEQGFKDPKYINNDANKRDVNINKFLSSLNL